MRKKLKIIGAMLTALVLVPTLLFFAYDMLVYQARRADLLVMIHNASPEERQLPPRVVGLIRKASGGNLSDLAARVLVQRLNVPKVLFDSQLGGHAAQVLWWALVALHVSEQDQLTVIAKCAPTGYYDGCYGLSGEALARFQRPLSALSMEEAATLVALIDHPELSSDDRSKHLAMRRDWLLSKQP